MGKLSPYEQRKREQAQAANAKRRAAELRYYQGRRLAYAMTLGNPALNEWLKI